MHSGHNALIFNFQKLHSLKWNVSWICAHECFMVWFSLFFRVMK